MNIKKYLPKCPHFKDEKVEKILRKVHFFLFKKYYTKIDLFNSNKPIYIWEPGKVQSTEEAVLEQPIITNISKPLPWEFREIINGN